MYKTKNILDDPFMLEMDDVEATSRELEDLIEDSFYEADGFASMRSLENIIEDGEIIEDSLVDPDAYDVELD